MRNDHEDVSESYDDESEHDPLDDTGLTLRSAISEASEKHRRQSFEAMEQNVEAVTEENKSLKERLLSLETQHVELQTEVGNAKRSVEELTTQLAQAKALTAAPKTMWNSATRSLVGKINETKLLNQVEGMEQELLEKEEKELLEKEGLRQEVEKLQDEIEALNEIVRLKDVELEKAQQALENERDGRITLEQEVQVLKERLDCQQEELVDVSRKSTRETSMMLAPGSLALDLLEDHDDELERLQEEKEKQEHAVESLLKENDKLKQKAHGVRFASVALQAVKDRERSASIVAEHEKEEFATKCEVLKAEVQEALTAYGQTEAALEQQCELSQVAAERGMAAWNEAQEYGEACGSMQESLAEARSSNEELEKYCADLQSIVVRLSKETGGLERELSKLHDKQGRVDSAVEDLSDAQVGKTLDECVAITRAAEETLRTLESSRCRLTAVPESDELFQKIQGLFLVQGLAAAEVRQVFKVDVPEALIHEYEHNRGRKVENELWFGSSGIDPRKILISEHCLDYRYSPFGNLGKGFHGAEFAAFSDGCFAFAVPDHPQKARQLILFKGISGKSFNYTSITQDPGPNDKANDNDGDLFKNLAKSQTFSAAPAGCDSVFAVDFCQACEGTELGKEMFHGTCECPWTPKEYQPEQYNESVVDAPTLVRRRISSPLHCLYPPRDFNCPADGQSQEWKHLQKIDSSEFPSYVLAVPLALVEYVHHGTEHEPAWWCWRCPGRAETVHEREVRELASSWNSKVSIEYETHMKQLQRARAAWQQAKEQEEAVRRRLAPALFRAVVRQDKLEKNATAGVIGVIHDFSERLHEEMQDAAPSQEWQHKCVALEKEISELRRNEEAANAQVEISETKFNNELQELFAEVRSARQAFTEEATHSNDGSAHAEELALEYKQLQSEAASEMQHLKDELQLASHEFLEEQRRADAAGENVGSEALSELSYEYQELLNQAQVVAEQGYQELQAAQLWREKTEEEAEQVATFRKDEAEQVATLSTQLRNAVEARQEAEEVRISSSNSENLEHTCEELKEQAVQDHQELQSCQDRLAALASRETHVEKLEREAYVRADERLSEIQHTELRCGDLQNNLESAMQVQQEYESSVEQASGRCEALEQECMALQDQVANALENTASELESSAQDASRQSELEQECAILGEVVQTSAARCAELEEECREFHDEVIKATQKSDASDEACLKLELMRTDLENESEKLQKEIARVLQIEKQSSEKAHALEDECTRLRAQQVNQVLTDELQLMNETLRGECDLWKTRAEQAEDEEHNRASSNGSGRASAELRSECSSLEGKIERALKGESSELAECKALRLQMEKTAKLEAAAQSSLEACKRERLLVQNQVVGDVANRCAMLRDQCERAMQAERQFRENAEMSVELRGLIGNLRKRMGDSS